MKTPVIGGLAIFNLAMYASRAGVGGAILNDVFNGVERTDLNVVSSTLVTVTLVMCVIGVAVSVAQMVHVLEWSNATRVTGWAAGAIVLLLDFLCMGLAIKQWQVGGDLGSQANFLGAGSVICVVTMLLQFLIIFTLQVDEESPHPPTAVKVAPREEQGLPVEEA